MATISISYPSSNPKRQFGTRQSHTRFVVIAQIGGEMFLELLNNIDQ